MAQPNPINKNLELVSLSLPLTTHQHQHQHHEPKSSMCVCVCVCVVHCALCVQKRIPPKKWGELTNFTLASSLRLATVVSSGWLEPTTIAIPDLLGWLVGWLVGYRRTNERTGRDDASNHSPLYLACMTHPLLYNPFAWTKFYHSNPARIDIPPPQGHTNTIPSAYIKHLGTFFFSFPGLADYCR